MNRILTTSIFMALCFTYCNTLCSQAISNDFSKIRNAYLTAKQLSFDVEVYTYSSESDRTPELLSKGYLKKSNDKYYSFFDNFEMLVNGDKALIVDRESKSMEYYEYSELQPEMAMGGQINIDSVVHETDSVIVRAPVNGLKHITCVSGSGYIRQTEM